MMKSKDEVLSCSQRFISDIGKPKTLVADCAKEFVSDHFNAMCYANQIRHETSAPYTPEENGKIERIWGTVVGMARCMLETASMGKEFWTYALNHAFNVKNVCLNASTGKIPFEEFYNKKPDVSGLRVFGVKFIVLWNPSFGKR